MRRAGIYGPGDYLNIVNEQLRFWNIDSLTGLDEKGKRRQQEILEFPKRIERFAYYLDTHAAPKRFSFDLVNNRSLEM